MRHLILNKSEDINNHTRANEHDFLPFEIESNQIWHTLVTSEDCLKGENKLKYRRQQRRNKLKNRYEKNAE